LQQEGSIEGTVIHASGVMEETFSLYTGNDGKARATRYYSLQVEKFRIVSEAMEDEFDDSAIIPTINSFQQGGSRAALKRLREKELESTRHPPAKRLHEDAVDTITRQLSHVSWQDEDEESEGELRKAAKTIVEPTRVERTTLSKTSKAKAVTKSTKTGVQPSNSPFASRLWSTKPAPPVVTETTTDKQAYVGEKSRSSEVILKETLSKPRSVNGVLLKGKGETVAPPSERNPLSQPAPVVLLDKTLSEVAGGSGVASGGERTPTPKPLRVEKNVVPTDSNARLETV